MIAPCLPGWLGQATSATAGVTTPNSFRGPEHPCSTASWAFEQCRATCRISPSAALADVLAYAVTPRAGKQYLCGHVRLALNRGGSMWIKQQCWSASRSSGPQIRYLTICPLDLGSFWIDFKTCFLADREPNFSLLVCHHVLTSLFARAFVRPERRNDDLAGPAPIGDTSPSRRCASPSPSCNWVVVEIPMERCR